ncbi:MAG TPA: tetratricopeptide repeat protein [Candidatus Polarisedimenticolia bacterium]|nr:tetratricopeptide repeat protein [Candidatus Polarisedimenticolia bacterium]
MPALPAAGVQALLADVVHLKSGSTITAEFCVRGSRELTCRRAGGSIGIPLDQVVSIERTPPRRVVRPAVPPASGPPPVAAGDPRMSLAPQEASPAGPGLTADQARSRAAELERSIGRPGVDEATARREAALLHTFIAGLAFRDGDAGEAEERYRLALGHDPDLLVTRLNLAALLINGGRHLEAETILGRVLEDHPRSARACFLLGESARQDGRPQEAAAHWERSLEIEPDPVLQEKLHRVRRLMEAEEGFRSTEAAHFTLKFDGEAASPELAREILDHLEAAWSELSARLQHVPTSTIRVTLYSRESFHRATESPDWVGGLFDGEIRLPVAGLATLNDAVRRVLVHELTHCFVSDRSGNRAPDWVQEGFAQVMEGRTGARHTASLAQSCGVLGVPACGAEFSYPSALSQVEFLLETWRVGGLNDLLDHLARGNDIDGALRAATGLGRDEFIGAWSQWLQR